MASTYEITYERLSAEDVKVIYSSGDKRTEIVARVVRPGTYLICNESCSDGEQNNQKT